MPSLPVSERRLVDIDYARQRFRVNRDAFRDPKIFEAEKELIFAKCWLYLGHASEIAQKGDFVSRTVAGRDLIFMHARSGALTALYNSCTHRGARICRDKRGSTKSFSCPYHGWVFNTEGKLLSMNAETGFVKDINADSGLDLKKVPRLEHYRGFHFVNFDANAVSLSDFLAGAKDFIDAMCDQSVSGEIAVLPGEHAYSVSANYKFMCENSYDGYHLLPTHVSYLEALDDKLGADTGQSAVAFIANAYKNQGRARGLGHGHAGLESWVPTGRPVASWIPPWGPELKKEIEATRARLEQRFGKQKSDFISDVQKNLVIFPNLVFNDNAGLTVRTIEPMSVNSMRINAWAFAPVGESAALTTVRLDNFVHFLGPAGFGSGDDVEMLELCQRGLDHTAVEWNEISRGMKQDGDIRTQICGPDEEGQMRAYWAQWDLMMRGQPAFGAG
jgi:p-cumate 2,3-dioxygenase subunit alpha